MPAIILVVEDVHETRDGIETLLMADGYTVAPARDERDAIERAQRTRPDLILISLAGSPHEVVLSARSIRERADVGERVPLVVFCIEGIDEGGEVEIGRNRIDGSHGQSSILVILMATNSERRDPP